MTAPIICPRCDQDVSMGDGGCEDPGCPHAYEAADQPTENGLMTWDAARRRRRYVAQTQLFWQLGTFSPEARANNIKLMRAYLSARPAEKLELGGRLLALDLEIWKLPTAAAERFLDEMERCQ